MLKIGKTLAMGRCEGKKIALLTPLNSSNVTRFFYRDCNSRRIGTSYATLRGALISRKLEASLRRFHFIL
jgi:hypothetical protein